MDYTNFVKNYYRMAINKLNNFSTYKGTFANLNYAPNIPSSEIYSVNMNFDALPEFEVNINSNVHNFENYLQYICDNTPELSVVALGKEGLKMFFEKYILSEEDDNKAIDKIDLTTSISLEYLKKSGIIE